jgi:3-methyladenine DNA glycosylase Tag
LSLPVYSDPALSEEVEALAREIIGTDSNLERQELAHRIAEAQIDLRRVRHVRHQLLSEALTDPDYESAIMQRKKLAAVIRCARALVHLRQCQTTCWNFWTRSRRGRTSSQLSSRTKLVSC